MKYFFYFGLLFANFIIVSCDLENEIELDSSQHDPKLVVESYLIPGKPFIVALTESTSYIGPSGVPKISGALVEVQYDGNVIKLHETVAGMYQSNVNVPYNYISEFVLTATDLNGRTIYGKTKIAPAVIIDTVKFLFNDKNLAAAAVYFDDPDSIDNFYRIYFMYIDDSRFSDKEYNGKTTPFISQYKIEEGKEFKILLLSINADCYDYFNSGYNAYSSNLRPLIEPAPFKSNVTGGLGVFTGLSLTEKAVIAKR